MTTGEPENKNDIVDAEFTAKPIAKVTVPPLTPEEQQAILVTYNTLIEAARSMGMSEQEYDDDGNLLPRKPVRLVTWSEALLESQVSLRRFKETLKVDENFRAEVEAMSEMADEIAEAVVRTEAIANRDVRAAAKIMDRSAAPKTLIDMRSVTVNNAAAPESDKPGYTPKKRVEQIAKHNEAAEEAMLQIQDMMRMVAPPKVEKGG